MDKAGALEKIKKCLALSKSSNVNEAGVALKQAQALMVAYGVGEDDVLASEVSEADAKSSAKKAPPVWEAALSDIVARAFACESIFCGGFYDGAWRFIGVGPAPELAAYAVQVLLRQARAARAEYIKDKLGRCKVATKTRRADLFCEAWVRSVSALVGEFAEPLERTRQAIAIYVSERYPQLSDLEARNRNQGGIRGHEVRDVIAGAAAGRNAQLHHGVAEKQLRITDAR